MAAFVKIALKILGLLVVGLAPFAILGMATGWSGINAASGFGFFVGFVATLSAGWRVGAQFSVIFMVLGTIGVALAALPLPAALVVAVAAALIAYFSTHGQAGLMLVAALFIPYLIHEPPTPWTGGTNTSSSYFAAVAGALLFAGLWGAVIGLWLQRYVPKSKPGAKSDATDALLAGILIAVVTGSVTFVSMTWFPEAMWPWLLLTIFILTKPTPDLNWKKSRDRLTGTLVGGAVAFVIILVGTPSAVMSVIGIVGLAAALALKTEGRPYWIYASVMTPAVIMLDSIGANEVMIAADRVLFTVVGVIIALGLGAAVNGVVHWSHANRTRSTGRTTTDVAT